MTLAGGQVGTSPARRPGPGGLPHWTPTAVAAGAVLGTVALRFRDPHVSGSWGLCPLRLLTGLDCPFCGSLRAVNDLTHGDLHAAAMSNLFFVVSIPLFVLAWVWWARGARATPRWAKVVLAFWAVAGLTFTVFRNTPWGHAFWA